MSVYNDKARVERAVASILDQTFAELELIVVDDGSTDGSDVLLQRLKATDSRLRVLRQDNQGLTLALIWGCSEAKGSYIARQDSDDWSTPDRLKGQVELMDSDARVGMVSCGTRYVGPNGEELSLETRAVDPIVATAEMRSFRLGPPAHGSVLFRKRLYDQVGGYRAAFYYAQDSDLWLRMAEHALVACIPGIHYVHRKEVTSTSGSGRKLQRRFAELGHRCSESRRAGLPEDPILAEAMELTESLRAGRIEASDSGAAVDAAYLIGSQLARNGDLRARGYLMGVLKANPLHWRAWVRLAQTIGSWRPRGRAGR